ncbi:MAG: UDP-N-acetylmuramate dehydrogenase [Clostridia bacterium]|nr:UDP-N-acetylmuramate dehydrogenase [Clostridia bacterium]
MLSNSSILEQYIEEAEREGHLTFRRDFPLSSLSSFRIGGNASYVIYPSTPDELASLSALCHSISIPNIVIGNGSNLLFSDSGYEGAVIVTTQIKDIKIDGNTVKVGCGASLTHLASVVAEASLTGLEFAYGIPGTVGGAVYMNAGAYGGEIKDVCVSVKAYDGVNDEIYDVKAEDCGFGYRESVFQDSDKIILGAKLVLSEGVNADITEKMNQLMQQRIDKQPLNYPSAGSTFKRYPGYFSGKLIEEAGLKGYTVGGAQVSEKHAGFIINVGNATASDVLSLIDHIREVIKENVGIELQTEVKYIENPADQ